MPRALPTVLLLALALALALALGALAPGSARAATEVVPGELVVAFGADATTTDRTRVRSLLGARVAERLPQPGVEVLSLPAGRSPQAAALALAADDAVRYAEPVFLWQPLRTEPNDVRFRQQSNLERIQAPLAWDVGTGAPSATIAVLDTGVAFDHQDLAPNEWRNPRETPDNGRDDDGNGYVDDVRGWDFAGADNDPHDDEGHGSHVAGIAGARGNDRYGVAGLAWSARLMSLRVCKEDGCRTTDQARAIKYAADSGARVANLSLGGGGASSLVRQAMTDAKDTLFVVAAGNEARDNDDPLTPTYPCNYDLVNVLCVTATDDADNLASFSNTGSRSVDLAAPGVAVLSSSPHQTLWRESWEAADFAGWTRRDTWGVVDGKATESPAGSYPSGANLVLQHDARSTAGRRRCVLNYLLATDLESGYDYLHVDITRNGTTWTEVRKHTGTLRPTLVRVPLGTGADEAAAFSVRFRVTSDEGVQGDGVALDDIEVVCERYDDPFLRISGTSMAAPHVSGAAALLFSQRSAATVAEVRKGLLDTVDRVPALAGRTVTGGRLNVFAAVRGFDTTPPDTRLVTAPPLATSAQDATFAYTAGESGATFECSLDGAPFTACGPTSAYQALPEGEHTFRVRAIDGAGNRDPEPAAHTWRIDRRSPETTIGAADGARVEFTADEEGVRFECALDGRPAAPCTSPATLDVGEGTHTFTVRAIDAAGNADPSPATATWTVRPNGETAPAPPSGGGGTSAPPPAGGRTNPPPAIASLPGTIGLEITARTPRALARTFTDLLGSTRATTLAAATALEVPFRAGRAGRLVVELRSGGTRVARTVRSYTRAGKRTVRLVPLTAARSLLRAGTRLTVDVAFNPRGPRRTQRAVRSARLP